MASEFVFAKKNGIIVHINDIPLSLRGKNCGAYCPKCGGPLIARMGNIRSHYFCHVNNPNNSCDFNDETGIHMLAKQIISTERTILLPPVDIKYIVYDRYHSAGIDHSSYYEKIPIIIDEIEVNKDDYSIISYLNNYIKVPINGNMIEKARLYDVYKVKFDTIYTEVFFNGRKIDLLGYKGNSQLGIEIKVTHGVDREKKNLLREKNLATIEIDLSEYLNMDLSDIDINEFKDMLVNTEKNKHWIVIKDEIEQASNLENKLYEKYKEINVNSLLKAKLDKDNQLKYQKQLKELSEKKQLLEKNKQEELNNYYRVKYNLYIDNQTDKIQKEYFINECLEQKTQKEVKSKMKNSERFYKGYIGIHIDSSILYFKCSNATWQIIIYYNLIFKSKIGHGVALSEVIKMFIEKSDCNQYLDFKFYESIHNNINNKIRPLHYIIRDYFEYLCILGILQKEPNYDFNSLYLTYYIKK